MPVAKTSFKSSRGGQRASTPRTPRGLVRLKSAGHHTFDNRPLRRPKKKRRKNRERKRQTCKGSWGYLEIRNRIQSTVRKLKGKGPPLHPNYKAVFQGPSFETGKRGGKKKKEADQKTLTTALRRKKQGLNLFQQQQDIGGGGTQKGRLLHLFRLGREI